MLQLVVSHKILEEYQRVGDTLAEQFPGVSLQRIFELVAMNAEVFSDQTLPEPVCDDPDDDKFIACALASGCKVIVSGDRHLSGSLAGVPHIACPALMRETK